MAPRFLTAVPLLLFLPLAVGGGVLGGCGSGHPSVQTVADDWVPAVARPEFAHATGPVVLVDAAHGNWHTIDGRFNVFARLLEKDGYQVRSADGPVSSQLLATADVFVIANAVKGGENSEWKLPTPEAFTADEIWQYLPGERNESVMLNTWYQGLSELPEGFGEDYNVFLAERGASDGDGDRDLANPFLEAAAEVAGEAESAEEESNPFLDDADEDADDDDDEAAQADEATATSR